MHSTYRLRHSSFGSFFGCKIVPIAAMMPTLTSMITSTPDCMVWIPIRHLNPDNLKAHALISTVAPRANKRAARRAGLRWGGSAGGFTISWAFSPRDYADGSAPPYPPRDRIACKSIELRASLPPIQRTLFQFRRQNGGFGGRSERRRLAEGQPPVSERSPPSKTKLFAERPCSGAERTFKSPRAYSIPIAGNSTDLSAILLRPIQRTRHQIPLSPIQRTCPRYPCAQFNGPARNYHG